MLQKSFNFFNIYSLGLKREKVVKENKKITQSERGVRIRLSVAGRAEYESNHIINILLYSIL